MIFAKLGTLLRESSCIMSGRRDYDDDKEKIRQFLEEYTSPDDGTGRKNFKYYDQLVKLAHRYLDGSRFTMVAGFVNSRQIFEFEYLSNRVISPVAENKRSW